MSEPESFLASEHPCEVHGYHYPPPWRTVTHHVVPLGWGGADEPPNKVRTCDNGHYAIHGGLDELRAGKPLRAGTRKERRYALRGYQEWLRSQPATAPGREAPTAGGQPSTRTDTDRDGEAWEPT
jgi:hypothetical protein